ncbi:MerR family transcriptional regulator [Verrucomicrobiaceae bacterium 227]
MTKKSAKKKCATPAKKAAFKKAIKQARETKAVVRKRLARVKENDPSLPLDKFVIRVNEIAERYLPPGPPSDGRVTSEFSERSVRNYQSKSIIDPPEKEGKEARYRYRNILQAVLIRVMLSDGFRVPMIREMLEGKTTAEYEELLEMGPIMARKMARKMAAGRAMRCQDGEHARSAWIRLEVAPGIEIHLSRSVAPPESKEEGQEIREKISLALREEFQRRRRRATRNE